VPSTAQLVATATNALGGPLNPEKQTLLQAVVEQPTEDNWRTAAHLIVDGSHFVTLWQAVAAVDPECPRDSEALTSYLPTSFTVRRALARALAGEVTR
jgi:hypothetical protein